MHNNILAQGQGLLQIWSRKSSIYHQIGRIIIIPQDVSRTCQVCLFQQGVGRCLEPHPARVSLQTSADLFEVASIHIRELETIAIKLLIDKAESSPVNMIPCQHVIAR